jgi:MFS family permease
MNFQKVNNITGWVVCLIACTVYLVTMEPTGSLWDCGEFVSCAYKLGIPHPPGAPLFILLGRIFTLFTPQDAAVGVNALSALASGFTILFLFWTITHFGRRFIQKGTEELSSHAVFNIMAAGVIGALAYTFSDSFWFSAVEGEVYALSSFFTALVFWAILRWEHEDVKAGNDDIKRTHAERWIILISFMMGLSIGVHLLNLLTIPAIVMVYYFRRYTPTLKGGLIAFLIGCIITGVVQVAVIQWSIGLAGWFDRLFVNSFGAPFFSGFIFFFVVVAVLIWALLRIAHQRSLRFLRLGIWSFAFMLVGYSTYITTMIRANADPGIDMNDVNNPISLVSYLGREQYGDIPLLKGQMFTADADYEEVGDTYQRVGDKYEITGKKRKAVYESDKTMVFPRLWDASNDQGHADYYAQFLGIEKLQDPQTGQTSYERDPDMKDNLNFFFNYQIRIMYWRYFMWNFAGKQNDIQGLGENRNGNWVSGISFIDNMLLGKQELMPDSLKKTAAHNKLYLLPLVLGLLGFSFQFYKHRKDWIISGLLFFFTGLAIVVYLNQAGPQPRERDYAYVGSFYAFAIWIGLGYFQVKEWIERLLKGVTASYIAAFLCLVAVPVLMAAEEWDDHDRSKKTIAVDLATNYLESCAPNAILFTVGDNDTYPLWYAQEVRGIRPDVRVINTSLLGTDWYINQLRYKVNESDPIDVIWTEDQIAGDNRNVVYYIPTDETSDTAWADLYDLMKNQAGSDDPNKMYRAQTGELLSYINAQNISIPVDKNVVLANGTANQKDSVLRAVRFKLSKGYIFKNDAAILNIIAANKWKRPVYFTQPLQIGFDEYLRQDGMTYRLVPVEGAREKVNADWMLNNIMTKFKYGGATNKGVYYDEENRRHMLSIRYVHTILAMNLNRDNRKEEAKKVLRYCDQQMPNSSVPYGMASRYGNDHNEKSMYFAMAAREAGDQELAKKVLGYVKKDLQQQMAYYTSLNESQIGPGQQYEFQMAQQLLQRVEELLK